MLRDKFLIIFLLVSIASFGQQRSKMLQASIQQASGGGGDVPRKMEIVLQSSQVTGTADLINFPVLITLDMLDTEIVDGGTNSAKSDGDDIQFYSDSGLTNRLSVDIVQFVASATSGDRRCTIFVKVPTLSYNSDTSIYIRYNDASATQPASDASFGSEDVWSEFVVASLDGYTNRADNTNLTAAASGSTTTTSNPFGTADYPIMDFDGATQYYYDTTGYDPTLGTTFYTWFEMDSNTVFARIYHFLHDSTNDSQMQFCNAGAVSAGRIISGYAIDLAGIATANTTFYDSVSASTWAFAGISTDNSYDADLFVNGTTNINDSATGLSNTTTAQTRFHIGGKADNTSRFDGRTIGWLLNSNKGFDWIETFYNNTSSPSTFGIEGTPTNL